MADFVFKNLAVKLLPADADAGALRAFEACTEPPECGDCTDITCQGCTSPSDLCGSCTEATDPPCGSCTVVTEIECHVCTCANHTEIPIISGPDEFRVGDASGAGDVRSELEAHKAHLRDALAATARAERRPQSLAEVDELRAQLEQALAELEERRAVLSARAKPDGG